MTGEMRCPQCVERGFYSRPMLRYTIGSIAVGGKVTVLCKSCKSYNELNATNQHGDGVRTFVVPVST